uniref:Organic solvent tolerance protein OstA n=1 Tax=Angiostrongylus cantonensis TaxID=6313 RepID=A0A0K0DR61_ANGCA
MADGILLVRLLSVSNMTHKEVRRKKVVDIHAKRKAAEATAESPTHWWPRGLEMNDLLWQSDYHSSPLKMLLMTILPTWWYIAVVFLSCALAQWNPNHVAINEKRKYIEADSSWLDKRQQEVALDASNKEKVILDLLNTQQRFSASASGNVAAADTYDGKRAQVQKIGEKGGIATVDGHKAQLRVKEDESGRHAFLKADGKYDLDAVASGDFKDPAVRLY